MSRKHNHGLAGFAEGFVTGFFLEALIQTGLFQAILLLIVGIIVAIGWVLWQIVRMIPLITGTGLLALPGWLVVKMTLGILLGAFLGIDTKSDTWGWIFYGIAFALSFAFFIRLRRNDDAERAQVALEAARPNHRGPMKTGMDDFLGPMKTEKDYR